MNEPFWMSSAPNGMYNNETRTYNLYDVDGNLVKSRPYTAAENVEADRYINAIFMWEQAQLALTELLASIETLKLVADKTNAQIGPADTKTVAREVRRVARQLVRLTRLFLGEVDSTDTGTE